MNTNTEDDMINLGDDVEEEHLNIMIDYCDTNGDNMLCFGEILECMVMVEN